MPSITVGCREIIVWSDGILLKREHGQRFLSKASITQLLLDTSDCTLQTITAIVDNKEQVALALFYSKNDGNPKEVYEFIVSNLYSPPT